MNRHLPRFHRSLERAAALVIVLAFVVLITGLVVAFFSNSLLYRQISNSSANAAKADLFAQGAMDTIIGDLKQEIAAGSAISTPAPGAKVYTPRAPLNAVPYPVGTPDPVATKNGSVNLLKRSAYDYSNSAPLPFYANPAAAAAASPTPYDTGAFAPSRRAAGVSSLTPSQNGRFISPARWNKHLLLQKKSAFTAAASGAPDTNDTDFTPVGATAASGSTAATWANAPDWVLVARDGSNPTGAFNGGMATSASGAGTVIGRYAYAVYDEGGLLDANVAGYPLSGNPPYTSANSDPKSSQKNALAFADLTQLPGISALAATPARQTAVINGLVGWRNYASAQPTGSLAAGFTFSPVQLTNFTTAMTGNTNGFLKTSNRALFQGQTDRMLSSRQELQRLLLNGIATSGSSAVAQTERANLQNALQYLGTFSRDLNQPSYSPDPNRPRIVGTPATGGNDKTGGDDVINPPVLSIRVAAPFLRNDGSQAAAGEPLAKKRFPLNRLAWLTYKGPSASNMGDPVVQQAITALGGNPTNAQDPVYQFVAQGTDDGTINTTIPRCFGLTWDTTNSRWKYLHGLNGATGPIMTLAQVATLTGAQAREADFFEMLKAGLTVGSLGKPGSPKATTSAQQGLPPDYQNGKDSSVDAQIMQIGANIVDQFDFDGIPTRLAFDDGSYPKPQEYRGVEDLPYFYRVRGGWMPLKDSSPLSMTYKEPYAPAGNTPVYAPPVPPASTPTPIHQIGYVHRVADLPPMNDGGLGVALQEPEIWNPHAYNTSTGAAVGLRPTQFRLVAVSDTPDAAVPANTLVAQATVRYAGGPGPDTSGNYGTSGYVTCPVSTLPQHLFTLTENTTALEFSIPTTRLDLFREPTLLIKPGVPAGSQLQFAATNRVRDAGAEPAIQSYLQSGAGGQGLKSLTAGAYPAVGATDDQLYLGIYLGAFPVRWADATYVYAVNYVTVSGAGANTITYRLQYSDPVSGKWQTYDEKYTASCYMANSNNNTDKGIGNAMLGDGVVRTYLDPRSSRFGMIQNQNNYNTPAATQWMPVNRGLTGAYGNTGPKAGWAGSATGQYNSSYQYAAQQNASWTCRPDESSGFSASGPATALGWFSGSVFRPGVICQNNPSAPNGNNRFNAAGSPYNAGYNGGEPGNSNAQFFADPDGVVRRGMSAYLQPDTTSISQPLPAQPPDQVPPGAPSGNPQSVAYAFSSGGVATPIGGTTTPTETPSRPIILNRPFRTVAELGYVYSGTPWRNLDFSTPESGSAALLDMFCVGDTDNAQGLVAGKVNLNTHQAPVLQAVLAGAATDEYAPASVLAATGNGSAQSIAGGLTTRTADSVAALGLGSGPLGNVSALVGRFIAKTTATGGAATTYDGALSYAGFSGLAATAAAPAANPPNLSAILALDTSAAGYTTRNVERFRESSVRTLASLGTTRVWNLMIDVVAQTGRYPVSAGTARVPLGAFLVEGEQRYWVHLAIDRATGTVLDKQIELVKE